MASITLNPSGYTGLSNLTTSSSYPISDGYDGTDSTSYARLSLGTSSTGYLYFTFDTSDIPSTATIQSVTGQVKVRVSSTSRVTSTVCQLYTGTTAKGSNTTFASTSSTNIITLSAGSSWTRGELDDLRLRVGGTGSSSSQSKYIYFYGADITITYVTESRTITVTLTGNGTVSPSGTNTYYEGDDIEVVITPTNHADTVTATKDGIDITSQLVAHGNEGSVNAVLGTYSLVSGSFNSGESWFEGIVGNGYDTSNTTTSNYYSGGSGTIAVFTYDMGVTVPSNANITRVYLMVNGHAESTSNSSEYMCAQLISGSTEITDELNFKDIGTSNTTETLEATTLPTVAQLAAMKMQCRLGYYGGAINGATVFVEYEISGSTGVDHYTYSFTVSGDSTIVVTIGSVAQNEIYRNVNGTWTEIAFTKVWKNVNGSWIEQSDLTTVFDNNTNYIIQNT